MYYSSNLVKIPKSSSPSSSVSHLALSIPILGLLVIFYTSALSLIRPNILDLLSSFCSCYAAILALNSAMVSFLLRLIDPRYEWSIIFGSWISNFAKPASDWLKKKLARGKL